LQNGTAGDAGSDGPLLLAERIARCSPIRCVGSRRKSSHVRQPGASRDYLRTFGFATLRPCRRASCKAAGRRETAAPQEVRPSAHDTGPGRGCHTSQRRYRDIHKLLRSYRFGPGNPAAARPEPGLLPGRRASRNLACVAPSRLLRFARSVPNSPSSRLKCCRDRR